MMFKLRIGDSHALLNPDQLDALLNILNGATCVGEKWVGDEKGFFGHNRAYEVCFEPYNVPVHFGTPQIFTDHDVDKYSTLAAMRAAQEK